MDVEDTLTAPGAAPVGRPDQRTVAVMSLGGAPTSLVAALNARLKDLGATVVPDPGLDTLMVLLLPSGPTGEPQPDLQSLGIHCADVVPVVFGDQASSWFSELSQIVRSPDDIDSVATRIGNLALLGGDSLVEVNDLTATAKHWDAHGRHPTDLLPGARVDTALPAVSKAQRADHPEAALLSDFLGASRTHAAQQLRLRRGIVSAAVLILVIAIILAIIQKTRADDAAEAALAQDHIATSSRLSNLARTMLTENPDPDHAWLLAGKALEEDDSSEATRIARMVADEIPPHRSILLSRMPTGIEASAAGNMAILFEDGSADLRDADGQIIRDFSAESAWKDAALSQRASSALLFGKEDILLNSAYEQGYPESRDTRLTTSAGVKGATWVAEKPVIATPSELLTVQDGGLVPAGLAPDPALGRIKGVTAATSGSRLSVWGEHGVWFSDNDGGSTFMIPLEGVYQVVLAQDGITAYVGTSNGSVHLVSIPQNAAPSVKWNVASALNHFAAGEYVLESTSVELLCPITPPAERAAHCITAHRGRVTGATSLGPDAGFATVGTDSYLRLWSHLNTGTFASSWTNGSTSTTYDVIDPQYLRGSRLECRPDLCWAYTGSNRTIGAIGVDLSHSEIRALRVQGSSVSGVALSTGGGYMAMPFMDGIAVVRLSSDGQYRWGWGDAARSIPSNPRSTGLSSDGSTLVVTTGDSVLIYRDGHSPLNIPTNGMPPVGILFDSDQAAGVYLTDGAVISESGSAFYSPNEQLRAIANHPASPERLWWINSDGALRVNDESGPRTVTRLPGDFDPHAIRVSPDGSMAALLAPHSSLVMRRDDGGILYASYSQSDLSSIRDITFVSDGILTIDQAGTIRHSPLTDKSDFTATFLNNTPRDLSPEELSLFDIPMR